jgi:hypothetical protein
MFFHVHNILQLSTVCITVWHGSGLFLEQTQAYIYIRLMASGIDKLHNCPKCLKENHFQNLMHMSET